MKIRKGDTGQQMVAGKGQWPQEERIVQDASALLELLLGLQLGSERYTMDVQCVNRRAVHRLFRLTMFRA